MSERKPADVVLAHFIGRLLVKLNREQLEECFERLWDELDHCKPDSYSSDMARRILGMSDVMESANAIAKELAEERVLRAQQDNSYDAERFRKISPVQESLGKIVPQLRGLRNCLNASIAALGEPLEALDPFVSKDRWG